MEKGKFLESERGSAQGNGASPTLANVYLHYVLDIWFNVVIKRQCKGEAYLIRYCDDFVCCFQNKKEAEIFYGMLIEWFKKFGLELALEKTKIIEFGRFARINRTEKGLRKPETFDFLGFTFYCGIDRNARYFSCKVKTCRKKFISKVKIMGKWIKRNQDIPLEELFKRINQKLRGHYQYYSVTDNIKCVQKFLYWTKMLLYKWLNRRSQRTSYTLDSFSKGLLATFPLLEPKVSVSIFYR